jgi:hypothetical protein
MTPSPIVGCHVSNSRRDLFGLRHIPGQRPSHAVIHDWLVTYRGTRAGALAQRRKSRAYVYQHSTDAPGSIDEVLTVVYSIRDFIESSHDRVLVSAVISADVRIINVGVLNA